VFIGISWVRVRCTIADSFLQYLSSGIRKYLSGSCGRRLGNIRYKSITDCNSFLGGKLTHRSIISTFVIDNIRANVIFRISRQAGQICCNIISLLRRNLLCIGHSGNRIGRTVTKALLCNSEVVTCCQNFSRC